MNIFVTDPDPVIATSYLCTEHLAKMPLESAQLLSTAVRYHWEKSRKNDVDKDWFDAWNNTVVNILYKATHAKHPSTLWILESLSNFNWLVRHAYAMDDYRLVPHASMSKINAAAYVANNCIDYPDIGLTPVKLAMPLEIKQKYGTLDSTGNYVAPIETAALAYREYICTKTFKPTRKEDKEAGRMRLPTWRNNTPPDWYVAPAI